MRSTLTLELSRDLRFLNCRSTKENLVHIKTARQLGWYAVISVSVDGIANIFLRRRETKQWQISSAINILDPQYRIWRPGGKVIDN